MNIHTAFLKTPSGELILGSYDDKLVLCDWRYRKMREQIDNKLKKGLETEFSGGKSDIIKETQSQLLEYFEGNRKVFDVPLRLVGTDFQKSVWNQLQTIPFGKTLSYLELSRKLGNEKAIRAVASANGANAISILIPCHRIIGSKGELVGYAGGLNAKKRLLELEDSNPNKQIELGF